HHLSLSQFPTAIESFNFDDFDLVISSSSAFAHGIITNGKPKHLCYVHSPARYLWDSTHDVLNRASKGILGPLKRLYLHKTFHKLRIWDAEVAPRPDVLIANSKEVQRRIELYWRRDSKVITPPIDDIWFSNNLKPVTCNLQPHFLIVSTLTQYKNIDIAILACNELKLPLTIVGEGPDEKRLKKLAGPTIKFMGYKSNEEVRDIYTNAKAVLFTSNDDFGLVPLEANACGTPVIALKVGGAKETVIDGETGIFFEAPTKESLMNTLKNFDDKKFNCEVCKNHAEKFRRSKFEEEIKNQINKITASS
ncbi:MAG: glycosyltransferase, partial [Candidatus Peribacteraceae bacterium]|nr:glycosyltransferase [Candidatus Peribacteraceae bacterium]